MSEVFIDNKYQGGYVGDLEALAGHFQGGDITNPLDVDDIEALISSQKNIDLIIDNKIPLTTEARGALDKLLKFHDKDYVNNFRSAYFTKQENDTRETPEKPTSEPSASEKLWKGLTERDFYSESYEHFKDKFSTPVGQMALYEAMKKQKLVSKDAGAFMNTFFPVTEETTEKVETTASNGADDSTVTPKVYNTKPKNAEEVQQSLFTLKDSIDGKNEIVTNRTVEKYFEEPLKGFDKWLKQNHKLKTKKVGSRYTTVPLSNEEREKYLKEYLGEQKYNEYIAWDNGNGELPTDSKDFDNVLNQEITERQKERQQEYLRTIPEQLRQDALLLMPDIFGGTMNLQTEVQSEEDEKEWNELYNPNGDNPLRGFKQRRARGRDGEWKLFTPPAGKAGSLDAGNKDYEKNIKLQGDYITNSYNSYKKDSKAYEDSVTAWNNENKGFTDELAQLELDFKKLGNVDKDSSKESIDAHNALVGDYKNLIQRMKSSGLDQKGTELTDLQTSLKNRFDDLMDKSERFEDVSMASAALGLNYDFGERLALQLESAAVDIGVLATGTLSALAEVSRILPGDQQDMEFYKHINNNYKASINYNESVKNKIQTSLPKAITWETRKGNIGAYAADMLANNSPSILTAMGSGGFGSLVTKGMSRAAAIATRKKLMKAPMAIFFGMEGGAKLADMEIAKKNAPKAIAFFDQELLRTDLSPAERQELLGLRSEQENALNVNQFQKAFSTIGYGGIAMYAERFGTLSYVNGLNRWGTTAGMSLAKKTLHGGANNIFNVGIELLEETGTQLGHNLIDITVLDQDKSMIEGIDTEFLVNVAFSSLAIQGPSMGMNSYNAIKGEVKSRQDINRDNKLAAELNEIQNVLSEGIGINAKDRKTLVARKREILEEAALNDIISLQRASRMTPQEVEQLFEINRENRKDIKTLRELGQSGEEISAIKNRKDEIADRINKRNEKRETLLSRDSQRRRAKLKELQKKGQITDGKLMTDASGKDIAVDLKTGDVVGTEEYLDPSAEFWLARHEYNEDIVRGLGNNVLNFKGENARENLVKYLDTKDLMGVEKAQILLGFDQGAYGTNVGSDAILFESSILRSIGAGGFAAKMASATALHETLHIQNRKAGIVKDNNIIEAARTAVGEIKNRINELAELGEISKEDKAEIDRRIKSYDGMTGVMLEELVNLAGDLKAAGIMGRESLSLVYAFKSLLNRAISKFNGGNDMFFTFKTVDDVLRYIDSFQGKLAKGDIALPPEEEVEIVGKESKAVEGKTPEQLVKTIQRGGNPKKVKEAQDALAPQFELLALSPKALNYDTRTGDIAREDVAAEAMTYFDGIVERFTPVDPKTGKKRKFSTFVVANMFPKRQVIYQKVKPLTYGETTSTDTKEARQIEGDAGTTTNLEDTFVQKINILQDFAITNRVANKIKALVKVAEGDTFKQVISKYAGKVGELIFDIPAEKITDGKANLIPTTKYKDGMPIPAEAQNIQRFFQAGENMSKFIKSLPLYNVADKNADIDKIGENIETPRNVFGVAVGLRGLPLDYFYENYTDPKAFSKDADVYEQRITSKGGRSRGVSTQTQVKKLKPEFINPKPEVIEKAKRDIGITPKLQENVYNRDIGQLQKGFAKVYSINASLSGGQRFLADKLAKAPVEKKPAIKKQIASVTAAQGKIAFSKAVKSVDAMYTLQGGAIKLTFEGDLDRVDKILKKFTGEGTYKFKDEEQIRDYFKDFEGIVIENLPRNMFMGALNSFLKPSKRILPNKGKSEITLEDGRTVTINDFFDEMRAELVKRSKEDYKGKDKVVFGAKFKGKGANYVYGRTYGKIYGKTEKEIKKSFYDGTREEYNGVFVSMHEQFMARVNSSIRKNNKNARVWGNYFSLVGQDTEHPWRMGAEWVLFSQNPIGAEGKLYEWEHAMMATRSYLYLLETSLEQIDGKYLDFERAYKLVMENYKLIALDNYEDKIKLGNSGRQKTMGQDWQFLINTWLDRYFHPEVAAIKGKNGFGIDPKRLRGEGGRTAADIYNINVEGKMPGMKTGINKTKKLNKAVAQGRKTIKESKGITVLDFDDTLATSKSLVISTSPDGVVRKLTAEEFAQEGADLLDQGWTHDFSEFSKVVDGKVASLFKKAMKLQGKFGPENMFVLTARPADSAPAIFEFLKANGLNIPLKNITGLANSTAESKALWIADKVGDGYNDFYFADDALQNVQAVDNMLEQFDVKRKVQQAKIKFSKGMNDQFNNILENVTGIEANKRFSIIKGRKRGEGKGKFRVFIPPSHEDFVGLLYNFLGKGKEGNAHRDFFEQALIRPLNRANREFDTARQSVANDYKELNKQFEDVRKKLTKKTADGDFTFQDAIRVYLWDKHGHKIPGLSETDQAKLAELVASDPQLQAYAETLNVISKQETYVNPTDGWNGGDIRMDLDDATGRIGRKQFFAEFIENADIIFSEENLNKIEAGYGKSVRESLEDMLYRIETGRNRPTGQNEQVNKLMNYLNGSVGTVMFFNMRSALLQQMSIVNYINFADNNIFAAAKAFANQKQYWKDFAFIFNSDMLKQRRGGIQTDINGAELAASLRNSKDITRKLISKLLELGFLPTQIGDNIAIATGGAAYYRNRINKYIKQGMSQKEAEAAAFTDFQDITQSTQQSARPDMVSKQQASVIGKVILNFQNVTSQFNRLGKKAFQDIYNRRITKPNSTQMQSDISNAARITYYFAIQNAIFYTLQTALFAMMFDDDEEDVNNLFIKKRERLINGSIDSVLRGSGLIGGVVATLKNVAIAFARQRDVKYNPDESAVGLEALNLSPVLGIKLRKIVNAEKTLNYNKKVIKEMETFDIDNPQWSAATNYTEAFTNIPLNRLYNKTQNVRQALNNDHSAWERSLMFLGWSQYNLDLENKKMEGIKEDIKVKSKIESKKKAKIKKEEKKKTDLKEKEAKGKEKQKKEKKEGKQATCLVCKLPVVKGKKYCTIHEKKEQRKGGEKKQCRKYKENGSRCGMQTSNKSGFCYYHD